MRRLLTTIAFALTLAACAHAPNPTRQLANPLIVVSLDGFRADYFDRGLTPTLAKLAQDGVRATAMRPSFPTVTEPNHYTLLTGLYPDHHGIVDNTMFAPDIPGWFGGPDKKVARDSRWWSQATPLWVSAERVFLHAGEVEWPGADLEVQGWRISFSALRADDRTLDQDIDEPLGWLDFPPLQRPNFILIHLSPVDEAGHLYGPDSPQVNQAIRDVDSAIGRLVDGLAKRGLADKTNLVIVSDHGMTATAPDRVILIDDFVDVSHLRVATYGAEIGVDPLPGREAEVSTAMLAAHPHLRCWPKAQIPQALHYGANPRVPAIFCLADSGWLVATRALADAARARFPDGLRGNHGYDPADPQMAAFFLAHGPAFAKGVTLPAFDNVDVYPLLAKVLGLDPLANDGKLSEVQAALAH
jgi:predicted AlkP superfamily pyrophosphatase or phosphodiesterase